MKLLILDHNDSFTFNLRQLISEAGCRDISVCAARDFIPSQAAGFDRIVFSPGPGIPEEFPAMKAVLQQFGMKLPILGVCLGHQAIASFFGAGLRNMPEVIHGKQKEIHPIVQDKLFEGISFPFKAGLYHSWIVEENAFPEVLEITAKAEDGGIMALRHRHFRIHGIQFHPESFMTPDGLQMMRNWLY